MKNLAMKDLESRACFSSPPSSDHVPVPGCQRLAAELAGPVA